VSRILKNLACCKWMHKVDTNKEGKSRWKAANPGLMGKTAVRVVDVYIYVYQYVCILVSQFPVTEIKTDTLKIAIN